MENILYLRDTVLFSPYTYEHQILIPILDSDISDIEFTIFGQPTRLALPNPAAGFANLHVSIDDIDVTFSVLESLKKILDEVTDQEALATQYKEAVEAWLDLEDHTHHPLKPIRLLNRRKAGKLFEERPISNLLTTLGDRSAGWEGNLHIFNFLYRNIRIRPLKLSEVISHHNELGGAQLSLQSIAGAVVTFSIGPSRFINDAWKELPEKPSGALCFTMAIRHPDTLALEIKRHIKWIRERLSARGEIRARLLGPTKREINEVNDSLKIHLEHVVNQERELRQLDNQVKELRDVISEL